MLKQEPPIHEIKEDFFEEKSVKLFLKREDLIHPEISGNKWRKLWYNIQKAKKDKYTSILTFGGAYSNHIAATAAAGKINNIKTIGIIRGDGFDTKNATLVKAKQNGMELHFVDRSTYRLRNNNEFIKQIKLDFPLSWVVPEGGGNFYGINGCMEILNDVSNTKFTHIASACGTGSTLAGMILKGNQQRFNFLGFPALKGDFMLDEIKKHLYPILWDDELIEESLKKTEIINDYHFGGYAKIKPPLVDFFNSFLAKHHIELDYVYTSKMLYGIYDLIKKDYFKAGSSILAIHTGGTQGNVSIKKRYELD